MSGVMIQMLMFEAEKEQLTLQADVGYMENYQALDEMKDYENLSAMEPGGGMMKQGQKFNLNPLAKKGKGHPGLVGSIGNALI